LRPHLRVKTGTPASKAATLSTVKATPSAVVLPAVSKRNAPNAEGARVEVDSKTRCLVVVSHDVLVPTLSLAE
jgi:hypothetical protein